MTMNSKTVSAKGQGSKDRGFHNTMVYVRQHWQLYLIFLMPAFLLTMIFKYAPMSGILIAFQDYNPFKGVSGSEWVGFKHFTRFLSSPDFMRYLINTLKLSVYSLLWGFPVPIILALLLNRIQSSGIKKKIQLVLYLPNFVSVIVLCGIVRIFLSVTGPVNLLLGTDMNFMTMPEAFRSIYNYQRNLAGSRLGVHHVYGIPVQCEPGAPGGCGYGRREYPAADPGGGVAGDQGYGCDSVYSAGRKYHEHRI